MQEQKDKNKLFWHTEKRKINNLVPAEYNPRQMTEIQAKELTKSLEKFDLVEIPAVDQDGTILAGHQRLAILKTMGRGEEEVDVRVPSRKLTDREAKEYNLRSNKNTGEWDLDKLFAMPEDLLRDVGWNDKDIQKLIDGHTDVEEDAYGIEEGMKLPCRVDRGDVWQLGSHRLMCGDSTKKEDVERLMDGKQADMVLTDPPYGVSYVGKTKDALMIANDEKTPEELKVFLEECFSQFPLKLGGVFYIFAPSGDQETDFRLALRSCRGLLLKQCIVWVKNRAVLGRQDFHWQHESVLFGWNEPDGDERILTGWKEGDSHYWGGDRKQTTVWCFERPSRNAEHPTMKPIPIMGKAVQLGSSGGEIVFDCFGGSGSTLIACEQTNRICYMMEIDPKYCTVILDRWEKFTGKEAVKISETQ